MCMIPYNTLAIIQCIPLLTYPPKTMYPFHLRFFKYITLD